MNLNSQPTTDQLRDLLRGCDDEAGDHLVWVGRDGRVRVSRLGRGQSAVDFERASGDEVRLRYETLVAGNGYVGPEAADDAEWVQRLFLALTEQWPAAKVGGQVVYAGDI